MGKYTNEIINEYCFNKSLREQLLVFNALRALEGKLQSDFEEESTELKQHLEDARSSIVYEFNEDEVPSFRNGGSQNVLETVVDAQRCSQLVDLISDLRLRLTHLEKKNKDLREINTSLRTNLLAPDDDSIAGSCNCLAKTLEVSFHKKGCRYRLIMERDQARKDAAVYKHEYEHLILPLDIKDGDPQPGQSRPVAPQRLGSNTCPKCHKPSLASEVCEECQNVVSEVPKDIPQWYSSEELYEALRRDNFSHSIAEMLAERYAINLQRAFVKGWTMSATTRAIPQ